MAPTAFNVVAARRHVPAVWYGARNSDITACLNAAATMMLNEWRQARSVLVGERVEVKAEGERTQWQRCLNAAAVQYEELVGRC